MPPCEQPRPPEPAAPRYSAHPLPGSRYLPGRTPRPDPGRPPAGNLDPRRWSACEAWLHAVDLYNGAFWWECHEVLEALYRGLPRGSPAREVLQGLVQIAAANLKRFLGRQAAAERLCARGAAHLRAVGGVALGLPLGSFAAQAENWVAGRRTAPPSIRLRGRPAARPPRRPA